MKKSAHEIWKKAKEQNLTEEQIKELMIFRKPKPLKFNTKKLSTEWVLQRKNLQ